MKLISSRLWSSTYWWVGTLHGTEGATYFWELSVYPVHIKSNKQKALPDSTEKK